MLGKKYSRETGYKQSIHGELINHKQAGQKDHFARAFQTLWQFWTTGKQADGASMPTVIGNEEALSEQRAWAGHTALTALF